MFLCSPLGAMSNLTISVKNSHAAKSPSSSFSWAESAMFSFLRANFQVEIKGFQGVFPANQSKNTSMTTLGI